MVNESLKQYIMENIFPLYQQNDLGHNLVHIKEVIRRCFVLNQSFKLNLDENMIFAIAVYHDLGKHIDHANHHHLIAGRLFFEDEKMKNFFNDEQRKIIREAIEDHRSSKKR